MSFYKEEDCKSGFFGYRQLPCCMCGEYTGYTSPYPMAIIYNISHACV